MNIEKSGRTIQTVEDWHRIAGPKSADHWKPGRSAFESANAWCGLGMPAMPPEIQQLLDSHVETRGCAMMSGTPELKVAFDQLTGEPRNADFAGIANHSKGPLAVSVEAKADESFGEYIGDILADAADRSAHGVSTNIALRIGDLLALVPPRAKRSDKAGNLRYQLLTALAGALAFAQTNKARAVLVVHEFHTWLTTPTRLRANQNDLNRFVRRLSVQSVKHVEAGKLYGPFEIVGKNGEFTQTPLFVGKAVRIIASAVT